MTAVLQEIINLLVSGLSDMATGIGTGLNNLMKNIFLDGEGNSTSPYTLSIFGGVVVTMAGIALAIGLSRFVVTYISQLGH